jgi:predicted PurR-regulated permease PerM
MPNKIENQSVFDITIRLLILLLIVTWCLMILYPFLSIILWSFILALAFAPLHKKLTGLMGGKPRIASAIIVLFSLAVIIVPSWFFLDSIIKEIKELKADFQGSSLTIPPPSESVRSWPIIGDPLYNLWQAASVDLGQVVVKYKDQLTVFGSKIAKGILSAASGTMQMMFSLIIAGVLLTIGGAGESIRKFFRKVAGARGDEFADLAVKTVGNVVKGIMVVALLQALLIGLGLFLSGVPFAGLITLAVFIIAILQIPAMLVTIPIIIYLFASKGLTPAILWSIYLLLAGMSDNVLKPVLLGKGAPVPMLVIFLGVIGGFILSGFIGLFTGAIIMSLGYKMFESWINAAPEREIRN